MAAVLEKQAKRWTYEEYSCLDDDQRYEIIAGNLLIAPAPDTWHQDWLSDIYVFLSQRFDNYSENKNCRSDSVRL